MKCQDENGRVYSSLKELREAYGVKPNAKLECIGNRVYRVLESANDKKPVKIEAEKKPSDSEMIESIRGELDFYREYAESVDADVAALKKVVEDLSAKNSALQSKLAGMSEVVRNCDAGSISLHTTESELYKDEITLTILSALQYARDNGVLGKRRSDIADDILSNNNPDTSYVDDVKENLKKCLNYTKFNEQVKVGLERLGFDYVGISNHAKFIYMGDERYTLTLSLTPSTLRGQLNSISEVVNTLFK